MRTRNRKYKIRIFFEKPVPYIAENGVLELNVTERSAKSAENTARQCASICTIANPERIEIEYKTEKCTKILSFNMQ